MRRTKIICTIGPACEKVETLMEMMRAGMNIARLNFSHGTHEEHARRIANIREAAGRVGKNIAILLDTKGPEIRLGYLEKEPVVLKAGQRVVLTTENIKGTPERLPITYAGLPRDVAPGNTVLIADGLIELRVINSNGHEVECEVVHGGELTSQKGVNLPGVPVNLPAITEQDIRDIKFGIEQELDFIAASFIRRASDVLAIRCILEEHGADMDIIAKIESKEGVENLDEIIKVADGIMVARGDLGVGLPVEEVPLIQKTIIEKCNLAGKPVITATQMLESMIHNPRPTRAEASDVANAILDGTDAIMLSGETAAGHYPVEAVKTMARIASRVERALPYEEILQRRGRALARTVTDAISHATCTTAQDLGAAAIITSTETGYTAKMVSKYRPRAPIIAVTPVARVLRKLALVWGVQPLLVGRTRDTDSMIASAIEASLAADLIKPGDLVIITAGVPVGVHGTTNLLKVHTVGDILVRGQGIGTRAVTGRVRVCHTLKDALEKVEPGDILVTPFTDKEFIPAIEKAAALITEVGGLTSHGAIVGLEFGIPVIVGVDAATSILTDGETVTVDGQRGLVYRGTARVL
ncbi:pyruvate kinase [Desulfofundulus thermosubterraneus]|uniref:Pyruvate kinase n=1 Tax=Desulfofundulus thermosubterraneus DSM 16057 TaxID=1121432 RepID=A0A1M6K6L6_9FIRM|nr:pyruvate kinase [Desulfofundulus thermosubterraneus]SHJ54591.1 pyruvate kinase [Desulfofundulus thermosubterraneus DSM 16057]